MTNLYCQSFTFFSKKLIFIDLNAQYTSTAKGITTTSNRKKFLKKSPRSIIAITSPKVNAIKKNISCHQMGNNCKRAESTETIFATFLSILSMFYSTPEPWGSYLNGTMERTNRELRVSAYKLPPDILTTTRFRNFFQLRFYLH